MKYILTWAVFLFFVGHVSGVVDTTVNKEVEVRNRYKPVIDKTNDRIDVNPELDVDSYKRNEIKYIPGKLSPQGGELGVSSIEANRVHWEESEHYDNSFIRLGLGNYQSLRGEMYLSMLNEENSALALYLKNHSTLGKVKLDNNFRSKMGLHDTYARLSFQQNFSNLELNTQVRYGYFGFRYYGLNNDGSSPLNRSQEGQQDFEMSVALGSSSGCTSTFKHKTRLYSELFEFKNYMRQVTWGVEGSYAYDLEEGRSVNLDADIYVDRYDTPGQENHFFTPQAMGGYYSHTFTLDMSPWYGFETSRWEVKLGLFASLLTGDTDANGEKKNRYFLAPDMEARFALQEHKTTVFTRVKGYTQGGDYRSSRRENPYLLPYWKVSEMKVPVDVTVGVDMQLMNYFQVHLWGAYALLNDQTLYTNAWRSGVNTFVGLDEKVKRSGVGFALSFFKRDFLDVKWETSYHNYQCEKQEQAWYLPGLESQLSVNYPYTENLSLGLTFVHESKRYKGFDITGNLARLPSYNDLSLNGTYKIKTNLELYMELNNLFSSNYYAWDGYKGVGFYVIAGACFKF